MKKTAEEIIKDIVEEMPFELNQSFKPYIYEAMKIYAKQVAQQALKDAGTEVAKMYKEAGYTNTGIKAKRAIDLIKIETP